MHETPGNLFVGQLIFFRLIENSGEHRPLLARAALILADVTPDEVGGDVGLSKILTRLSWDEYHGLLGMLFLRRNTALSWLDYQTAELKNWAGHG